MSSPAGKMLLKMATPSFESRRIARGRDDQQPTARTKRTRGQLESGNASLAEEAVEALLDLLDTRAERDRRGHGRQQIFDQECRQAERRTTQRGQPEQRDSKRALAKHDLFAFAQH